MKTVVVTSPALVNGENPRQATTDFSRSNIVYYDLMIDRISGVQFNGNSPEDVIDVQQETSEILPNGKPARILDLIGNPVKRNAAIRLYGGKLEIVRPDDEDEDGAEDEERTDYFDSESLMARHERETAKKEIYSLALNRKYVMRHSLGIEDIKGTGKTTEPTHEIYYHFSEPEGKEYSKWEMHGYTGLATTLKNGGTRLERYHNLDAMRFLFDALVEKIEGASVGGQEINLSSDRENPQRKAILAAVPLAIKKLTIPLLFSELERLGND